MTPERVYERFIQEFPHFESQISRWFRRHSDSGGSSIRIMLKNGRSLIFDIAPDGSWTLGHGGGRR